MGVIEDDPDSSAANEVSLELRFLIGRHGLNLIHDKVNLHKGARLLLLAETQTTHQTWMLPPAVKTSLRTVDSSFQDRLRPEALYS